MLQKYFAAEDADRCTAELLNRAKTFYEDPTCNSYLNMLRRCWEMYYNFNSNVSGSNTHTIQFTGDQGELVNLPVNHFHNLGQHIYVMITGSRPTMEARAINTDYKSLSQALLANNILDYYMRERKLETVINKATELSIVLGSAYVKLDWNATAGEMVDFDDETSQPYYEGDVEFSYLSPFDVVMDGTKESYSDEWLLVRTFKNKFSLMAKYPELAEKIQGLRTKSDRSLYQLAIFSNDKTEDIPVYEFFHKRTEALPNGRYLLFLEENITLLDAQLPYRNIPIYRIAPNEILGTPYGYTPMFDIYPICQGINSLYSTILTNQNAFGVQNVFVPRSSDLTYSSLPGGLNLMEGNEPPIPINLTQTPKEVFEYLNMLIKAAETISGVNSVSRGFPESSLKSGTALALVQSMALQFVSGLQQSYVKLIEDIGTSLVNILKDFATTPRVMQLVGKNNQAYLKEFQGEQINSISRVIVTVGSALSKTEGGRIQMVEQMTQMKLITTPQQYIQVLNTGNLDVATESTTGQLLLIKKENEKIMDGVNPSVFPTDQHQLHINEHSNVVNDPDLRDNPELLKVLNDHLEAHLKALRETDPQLLSLTGQQSLMPAMPPPPGGAPPGAPHSSGPSHNAGPPHAPGSGGGAVGQGMGKMLESASNQSNVQGPNGENSRLPSLPKPPKPFQHNAVLSKNVVPQ